jgi:hypothetical protein
MDRTPNAALAARPRPRGKKPFEERSFDVCGDLSRRGWRVRAGQQALVDPPDLAVAFADRFFETRSVITLMPRLCRIRPAV